MLVEHLLMTPELAAEILEGNDQNFRRIDTRKVNRLARSITDGKWEDNGETIKIDTAKKVLDGQHRLWAVVESGIAVPMLVVKDLACEGVMIDRGTQRTIAQWLSHKQVKSASRVAAVARAVVQYHSKAWDLVNPNNALTHEQEIIDFALEHQDAIRNASKVARQTPPYSHTIKAAIAFIASGSGENLPEECETVKWFFDALRGKVDSSPTDPVFQLRNKWIKLRAGQTLPTALQKAVLTIGWNMTARDQAATNRSFSFRVTGPKAIAIPNKIDLAPELRIGSGSTKVVDHLASVTAKYASMKGN